MGASEVGLRLSRPPKPIEGASDAGDTVLPWLSNLMPPGSDLRIPLLLPVFSLLFCPRNVGVSTEGACGSKSNRFLGRGLGRPGLAVEALRLQHNNSKGA